MRCPGPSEPRARPSPVPTRLPSSRIDLSMTIATAVHRIDRTFVERTARFSLAYAERVDNDVVAELVRVAPELRRHDRKAVASIIRRALNAASGAAVNAGQWRDALTALDRA